MPVRKIGPAEIPSVGFGTFKVDGGSAADLVEAAISEGYRHIDTAQAYENEAEVGEGIRRAATPRDQVFLTTKILPKNFRPDDFREAAHASLKALGTDYVDLLLLHWPSKEVPVEDTLGVMNELIAEGKVRHGGISNFTIVQTKQARAALDTPLAANQVEMHPFLDQTKLLGALNELGVPFEAYAPLARGKTVDDPVLTEIGEAHGVSGPQVALAWILSKKDSIVLPKTGNKDRLAGNLAAADIELSADEIARIDGLARPDGRLIDPDDMAPDWD